MALRPDMNRIRYGSAIMLGLWLAGLGSAGATPVTGGLSDLQLHTGATVIDLHADTLTEMLSRGRAFTRPSVNAQVSPALLRQGGVDAQVFVIWVSPRDPRPNKTALAQLAAFEREVVAPSTGLIAARTAGDVRKAVEAGRVAALLAIEGALALDGRIEALDVFANAGLRYMALAWNEANPFASGAGAPSDTGLTVLGRQLLNRLNALHIIPDVSHASTATFWDLITRSSRPVIASHSNAAALVPHPRNLDDVQLWALAESGGLIGVNFHAPFLRATGKATIDDLIDHVAHIRDVAGIDHVGIGSDFDGRIRTLAGLSDAGSFGNLTTALRRRGFSQDAILALLGGNALRVMTETDEGREALRVDHRPAVVEFATASIHATDAERAVDRNARTAWSVEPASLAFGQHVTVRAMGPGVDQVALCAAGPGRPSAVSEVLIIATCDDDGRKLTASRLLGDEVRPQRVSLAGMETCARVSIDVTVTGIDTLRREARISEIVPEIRASNDP